jgi:hypothetical protein
MRKPLLVTLASVISVELCTVVFALGVAPAHAQELPPIKVDLPPQPNWDAPTIPEKWPDGRWSIRGLRKKLKANLNQEVEVKGFLLEVYECPPEQAKCPKGKTCKPCDQPHFFVGDAKDTRKDRGIVVCNYPVKPKPNLPKSGTELVVSGTFTQEAGGFAASDGLINHQKTTLVDGNKVVAQGNSQAQLEEKTVKAVDAARKGLPPKK